MLPRTCPTRAEVAVALNTDATNVYDAAEAVATGFKSVKEAVGTDGSCYAIVCGKTRKMYVGSSQGKTGGQSTADRLLCHFSLNGSKGFAADYLEGVIRLEDLFIVILAVLPTPTGVNTIVLREQAFIDLWCPVWNSRNAVTGGVPPWAHTWSLTPEQIAKITAYYTPEKRAAIAERVKNEAKEIRDRKTASLKKHQAKTVNRYSVLCEATGELTSNLAAKEVCITTGIAARSFARYMETSQGEGFTKRGFVVTKLFSNPYYNYGGPANSGATGYRKNGKGKGK